MIPVLNETVRENKTTEAANSPMNSSIKNANRQNHHSGFQLQRLFTQVNQLLTVQLIENQNFYVETSQSSELDDSHLNDSERLPGEQLLQASSLTQGSSENSFGLRNRFGLRRRRIAPALQRNSRIMNIGVDSDQTV